MRRGLNKRHPFANALLAKVDEMLKGLVEKDRRESEVGRKDVASAKTARYLSRLAQLAARFLKENIDSPELGAGEEKAVDAALEAGNFDSAAGAKNRRRRRANSLRVHQKNPCTTAKRKSGCKATTRRFWLSRKRSPTRILKPHPKKDEVVYDSFKVRGVAPGMTDIVIRHGNNLRIKAAVEVSLNREKNEHGFASPLEFERAKYEVAEGKSKILKLFARFPELIRESTTVYVDSDNPDCAPVMRGGRCVLSPVPESNYAEGEIEIKGRSLTDNPAVITARMGDIHAQTKISVKERRIVGGGLRIEFAQESLGHLRARWKDPAVVDMSVILISSDHPSIKPYLGSSQNVEEQDTAQFRVLLAELVSEVLCAGILNQEMRNNPGGWEQSGTPARSIRFVELPPAGKNQRFLDPRHTKTLRILSVSDAPHRGSSATNRNHAIGRWARFGSYYAMFPVDFAFEKIERHSRLGELVIDPFAGRGTSVFAAAALGRIGVGIEINPVGWVYRQSEDRARKKRNGDRNAWRRWKRRRPSIRKRRKKCRLFFKCASIRMSCLSCSPQEKSCNGKPAASMRH